MKPKDLINLLNRAASGLETPEDLSSLEKQDLIADLVLAAQWYSKKQALAEKVISYDPN